MNKYVRLTLPEREEISRLLAAGYSLRKISNILGRSTSSISREIRRSVVDLILYRAIFAHQRAIKRRHKLRGNHKLDNNKALREIVLYYLKKFWSPEQIAKRLKFLYPENMDMRISHETIYSYIYVLPKGKLKSKLISCLRRNHKYRRRKGYNRVGCGTIQDYLSIEERPKEIADRIIPGHWEGDLIVGRRNQSCIGTLVERTTRMTFIVKMNNQDSMTARKAFAKEFSKIPKGLKKTLTYDQGQEMAQHKLFTKETDITVYFAHPRSPWERGSNENTNALIRQYFPKGTDFNGIKEKTLKEVQDELNDRPRKTLGWRTPHEKFAEVLH
ncbi:MAG: IS30 family transposase [Candidatus Omnitrophota bacterium]